LPGGTDPDSFIRQEKGGPFEKILAEASPLVEFLFDQALRRHRPDSVEGKVRIVRELIPALSRLQDPLERNLYIERIALRLGLKEVQIRDQLRGKEPAPAGPEKPSPPARQGPAHERVLLQLMLLDPSAIPRIQEVVGKEGFSDLRNQKLVRKLLALKERGEAIDPQRFLSGEEEEDLRDLVSELLLGEESLLDPERMLEDCLRMVKISRIRQEIQQVDEEIRQRSRQEKDAPWSVPGLKELLKRKQRLILEQKRWSGGPADPVPHQGG
jgi:DNA primase